MSGRTIRSIIEGQELITAPQSMPVGEAARLMKSHNVGAILVVEGDQLVGVFTERDALGPELKDFVFEMLRHEQTTDVLA